MEFMKKFRIGSGMQNFHIRTPLVHSSVEQIGDFAILIQS